MDDTVGGPGGPDRTSEAVAWGFGVQGRGTGSSFKVRGRRDTMGTAAVAAVKLAELTSATTYPVVEPPAVPVMFPVTPNDQAPTSHGDSGRVSVEVASDTTKGNAPVHTSRGSGGDNINEVYI